MLMMPEGPERDKLLFNMRPGRGSRRYRRMVGRANWIPSTPSAPIAAANQPRSATRSAARRTRPKTSD